MSKQKKADDFPADDLSATSLGGEPESKPAAAEAPLAETKATAAAVDKRPLWIVRPLCATPMEVPELEVHAENEQEAEAEYRRIANVVGQVANGFSITKITK